MTHKSLPSLLAAATIAGLALCCLALLCRSGQAEPARLTLDDLNVLTPQLERDAMRLRGLERRQAIRWAAVNRQQLQIYIRNLFMQQYAPGELRREGDAYKALGLIAPGVDYENLIVMLLEEQTGGYYDPQRDTFYVADWMAPAQQSDAIIHELTHALQDQHFRLDDFTHRMRGNTDAMLARAALVEGEAVWVGLAYASGADDLDQFYPAFDGQEGAPSFLDAALMFPYEQGLAFVNDGRRRGGWRRLNQAYASLPVSTEQILHPERYFERRDDPATLQLPDPAGLADQGWRHIYSDVLGEFVLRHLIAAQGEANEAAIAAAGWDGDRFQAFRRQDELAWIQLSAWDTLRDAQEYAAAMGRVLSKQHPEFLWLANAASANMAWRHPQRDRVMAIHQRGEQALIIRNLDAASAQRLRQQVWPQAPAR